MFPAFLKKAIAKQPKQIEYQDLARLRVRYLRTTAVKKEKPKTVN